MLLIILISVGFWSLIWGAMFGITWLLWAGVALLALGILIAERIYRSAS